MKNILLIVSVALLLLSGCGSKDGVITSSKKAYLIFTGNIKNTSVSIDNGSKFNIDNNENIKYELEPGKHLVEVFRANTLVVKREVFISDGISKEIKVK